MAASFAAAVRMMGDWGFVVLLVLAPSAYLASAASTATLVLKLLPSCLHHISDRSTPNTRAAWQSAVRACKTLAPVDLAATRQRSWDDPCCQRRSRHCCWNSAVNDREKARDSAPVSLPRSGAWLQALPISSVRLCGWTTTSSGWLWVCVSAPTCAREPHTCTHAVSLWMPVARMGWPAREAQGVTPATRLPAQRRRVAGRDAACAPGPVRGQGEPAGTQQVRTGKQS